MNIEHTTPELFSALAKSQGEIENAKKGSVNPHFKSRYADLAEILNTVRPVLSANALSTIQNAEFDGSMVSVETVLCHAGGGWVSGKISCVPAKADAQGIGSSITYLRRYGLAAIVGIAQEDDDGQSATHSKPVPAKPADIASIREAVEELAIDHEAFEKYLGGPLAEMSVEQYKKAITAISNKRKQAAKA